MGKLTAWVAKRPVSAFYLLSIALSWSYWLSLLAAGMRVGQGTHATHLPGLAGPMLAAALITRVAFGRRALIDLLKRAVTFPAPRLRNGLLALSPLLLGLPVIGVVSWASGSWPALDDFSQYPGLPPTVPLWASFSIALMINGYGEEAGWRGFAIHHLCRDLGRFRGTFAVAGLWLLWHAPLFWLVANIHALLGPAFFGWAAGLIAGAFVLAALYLGSRSILLVAVWHTLFNFMVATPAGTGVPAAVLSTSVMIAGAVIAVLWWRADREQVSRAR